VAARRLERVLAVASVKRVALVHDLGQHGPAVGADPYVLVAAPALVVPPRGQRHDALRVPVELAVALRRVAAVVEVVERHDRLRVRRGRRRARVRRVGLPASQQSSHVWLLLARLAAVGKLSSVAVIVVASAAATCWEDGKHQEACTCKH
jgi:hypothetical protein